MGKCEKLARELMATGAQVDAMENRKKGAIVRQPPLLSQLLRVERVMLVD